MMNDDDLITFIHLVIGSCFRYKPIKLFFFLIYKVNLLVKLAEEYLQAGQTGHVLQTHNKRSSELVSFRIPFLGVSAPPIFQAHLYPENHVEHFRVV